MILNIGKPPANFWNLNIYSDDEKRLLAGEEIKVSPKCLEGRVLSVAFGNVDGNVSVNDSEIYSVVLNKDLWMKYRSGEVEMIAIRGMGDYDFDRFTVLYVDCNGENVSSKMND